MRFTFDDLTAIMARLRGPEGCPWDRQQTHASLVPYLLEEAHEVMEAIDRGDAAALQGELGDLLLQVVFHAEMAREAGGFDAHDVVDGLVRKLIERHPHVFGPARLETPDEVLAQWHELKRREAPERGPFEGIPPSLPALARAQKVQGRAADAAAAGAGLPAEVFEAAAAVAERLHRAVAVVAPPGATLAGDPDAGPDADARVPGIGAERPSPEEVVGDLLFAVVRLATLAGVDAESALRQATVRFVRAAQTTG